MGYESKAISIKSRIVNAQTNHLLLLPCFFGKRERVRPNPGITKRPHWKTNLVETAQYVELWVILGREALTCDGVVLQRKCFNIVESFELAPDTQKQFNPGDSTVSTIFRRCRGRQNCGVNLQTFDDTWVEQRCAVKTFVEREGLIETTFALPFHED